MLTNTQTIVRNFKPKTELNFEKEKLQNDLVLPHCFQYKRSVPVMDFRNSQLSKFLLGQNGASSTVWFAVLVVASVVIQYFLKAKHRCRKENIHSTTVIPYLKPRYPIIGNVPIGVSFSKFCKYAEEVSQTCGELVQFSFLHVKGVVINSAPLAQTIFKSTDFGHLTKQDEFRYYLEPLMVNGVGQSSGKVWQKQRKILMQSQKYSVLKLQISNICWHSIQLLSFLEDRFQSSEPHEIFDLLGTTFLRLVIGK